MSPSTGHTNLNALQAIIHKHGTFFFFFNRLFILFFFYFEVNTASDNMLIAMTSAHIYCSSIKGKMMKVLSAKNADAVKRKAFFLKDFI